MQKGIIHHNNEFVYILLNEIRKRITSKQLVLHDYLPVIGFWHSIRLQPSGLGFSSDAESSYGGESQFSQPLDQFARPLHQPDNLHCHNKLYSWPLMILIVVSLTFLISWLLFRVLIPRTPQLSIQNSNSNQNNIDSALSWQNTVTDMGMKSEFLFR